MEAESVAPVASPPSFRRANEPDTTPHIPPPRQPRPRSPGPYGYDEFPEPSGPTRPSINLLTSRLAALGPGLQIKVRRLQPAALPACEAGWTTWQDVGDPAPTAETVERFILERWGGGEFLIKLRSMNSQREEEDTVRLPLAGDWIPQTDEGRAIKARQIAAGGVMPQTGPTVASSSAEALEVVKDSMRLAKEDKEQAREIEARSRSETTNAMVELAKTLHATNGDGGGGLAAVLAAMIQSQTEMARIAAEDRRAAAERDARERAEAEERRREDQRRAEEKFERLVGEIKAAQNPDVAAKMMQWQMDTWGQVFRDSAKKAFELMLVGKTEEEAGPIRRALAALIEHAGPKLIESGAAMLPHLLGAQNHGAGPGAPRPIMAPGAPTVPVLVPASPGAPPQAARPSSPVPQAPEQGGAPKEAEPGPSRPEYAAASFLQCVAQFAGERPDPEAAWMFPIQGMALHVVFGLCPPSFRSAVQAVDIDGDGLIDPTPWVGGLHQALAPIAQAAQAALATHEASEWLRDFLDAGPWGSAAGGDAEDRP